MIKIESITKNVSIPIEYGMFENNIQILIVYHNSEGAEESQSINVAEYLCDSFICLLTQDIGCNINHIVKHHFNGRNDVCTTNITFVYNGTNDVLYKKIIEEKIKI